MSSAAVDTATNGTPPAAITAESDWRGFAPEDVKDDLKSLESVKDFAGLIKTAVHGQKALGASIRLPGKDAKPEDVARAKEDILGKLRTAGMLDGAPGKPEDYGIEIPEVAAVLGWDHESFGAFLGEMHKVGATKTQIETAIKAYEAFTQRGIAAEKAERDRVQGELSREWGPNYKPNVGLANKAVQSLDAEIGAKGELIGYLQTVGAADHPLVVKAMAWLGKSMWEHGVIDGVSGMVGAEEAATKLRAMESDRTHPLNMRTHPEHAAAVDEALALHKILNRGGR